MWKKNQKIHKETLSLVAIEIKLLVRKLDKYN